MVGLAAQGQEFPPRRAVHPTSEWTKTGRRNWISIRRQSPTYLNKPPVVYAGPDRAVPGLGNVALVSAVADERDVSDLTLAWSKIAGPGKVRFSKTVTPRGKVDFSQPGIYTLRLTANDGEFESQDDVMIRAGFADQ